MTTTGKARTRAGEVAYESRGEGPPLVLLHANGHTRRDFDAIVPALSRRFRTIAVDSPGMGDSDAAPPSPASTTAALYADVLEDLVEALALPPAIFLGNSIGGFAATRLAARRPERVRALVLVDTGGFTEQNALTRAFCWWKGHEWVTRRFERAFAGFYLKKRNEHVEAMLRRADEARRDPARVAVIAAIWRSFADASSSVVAEAPRVRCPTLIAWGRRDPVVRAKVEGRLAARTIPGARYVEFDTGHSPFAEDTEAFLAEATPFLESVA